MAHHYHDLAQRGTGREPLQIWGESWVERSTPHQLLRDPAGRTLNLLFFPLPVSCWFSPCYKPNRTRSQRARRSTPLWVRIQKQRAGRSRDLEEQVRSIFKHRRCGQRGIDWHHLQAWKYRQGGNDWHLRCRGSSGKFLEVLASLVLYTAAKGLGTP